MWPRNYLNVNKKHSTIKLHQKEIIFLSGVVMCMTKTKQKCSVEI